MGVGNGTIALAAATELEYVGMGRRLHLVILEDGDEPRFRRAVVRWQARYCQQLRDVDGAEATALLGLLLMLGGKRRAQACRGLAELLDRREMLSAGELLLGCAGR